MGNQSTRRSRRPSSEDGVALEPQQEQEEARTDTSSRTEPIDIPSESQYFSFPPLTPQLNTPRRFAANAEPDNVEKAHADAEKDASSSTVPKNDRPKSSDRRYRPVPIDLSEPFVDSSPEELGARIIKKHERIHRQHALARLLAQGEYMDEPKAEAQQEGQSPSPSPSLAIDDNDLRAVAIGRHNRESEELNDLARYRVTSDEAKKLEDVKQSPVFASFDRRGSGAGPSQSNARASLERLLKRSDELMGEDVAERLEAPSPRPTPRIPPRPERRFVQPDVERSSSMMSSDTLQDGPGRLPQFHRDADYPRARNLSTPPHSRPDSVRQDAGPRRRGHVRSKSVTDVGSIAMQRDRPQPFADQRGRSEDLGLPLDNRHRWRSQSRARFERAPESPPKTKDKGKAKVSDVEPASQPSKPFFTAGQSSYYNADEAIKAFVREQAMEDLNAPSAYEQMPQELQDKIHPVEVDNDCRPWPWNTQPDKLPAGVADCSHIQGLHNIGWYCPGAERFARDLNDGSIKSAEAVEQARERWLDGLVQEEARKQYELIQRQQELIQRQLRRERAVQWHLRHHSEPVTGHERRAQMEHNATHVKHVEYAEANDHELIKTRDGRVVKFPLGAETFPDDEAHPFTGSVPIHFQLLDGRTDEARLLVRTRTFRQLPQAHSRNRSQGPSRPRSRRSLHFSLDGAHDSSSQSHSTCLIYSDQSPESEEETLWDKGPPHEFADDSLFKVGSDLCETPSVSRSSPGSGGMSPSLLSNYHNSAYGSPGAPGQNMVRQTPSPQNSMQQSTMQQQVQQQQQQQQQQQASVAQHQANGMHGGANSAAALQSALGHTGHQPDFNYLWSIVQDLTEALAQNRAQTASIVRGVQQIQARAREEGEGGEVPSVQQVNGELAHAAEIADLQNRLHEMTRDRDDIAAQHAESVHILADYERTMDSLMIKIRDYANSHAKAMIGVHQHYESQLAAERDANLQLRIEHGQWQAGLGRAAELARVALRTRTEETGSLETGLREVRAENRILRKIVGWEVEDSSDEEEPSAEPNVTGSRFHDGPPMRAAPDIPRM